MGDQSTRRKTAIRPLLTRLIALTVFWLVVFIAVEPLSADNIARRGDFSTTLGVDIRSIESELSRGTVLTQSFVAPGDNLKGFDIRFATYKRPVICRFTVSVVDESGHTICKEDVDSSELSDFQYRHFDIPVQADSKGKQYEIRLRGVNGKPGSSTKVWGRTHNGDDAVRINGKPADYALDAKVYCRRPYVYPAVFAVIIALSYAVAVLATGLNERSFLWLCLLLGILFIVINPFQHLLDENTHYIKSMAISRFTPHEIIVDGESGFMLPSNVDNVYEFDLNHHLEMLSVPYDSPIVFYPTAYSTSIIPINHMVGAVGLLLARVFGMSIGLTVWTGRLISYLFYVMMCYFAIKNTKYYKSLIFVVAALPAALWMGASYSTDPVLLAASLLFISTCLKYRFSDEKRVVTRTDMAILVGCGICVLSVKYFIYFPVVATLFFIPRECFKKNQRRNLLIAMAVVIVVLGIWQYRLLKEFPIREKRTDGTDFGGQIAFVFGHIGFTINNFLNWFLNNIVGHMQGSFYNSLFSNISAFCGSLCILSAAVAADKYPAARIGHTRALSVYCIVSFLFVTLLIMASLYAGFTPVGASGIAGLQPRYFQPVMLFVMLPLALTRIENHIEHYGTFMLMLLECYLLLEMTQLFMNAML
ncbi:MAG: DUF2142 domain-containing protein [Clostridia bacterium]|nr:DUF2142 domain-containing protein [Clostridia bacterium]